MKGYEINIDEIKEILDYIDDRVISSEKWNKVKDYIIYLQEENDILKRDTEAMKHNYNLLVRLIENGESMTQKFENGLTYQDYKSRNEKAIEHIEESLYILKGDSDIPILTGNVRNRYLKPVLNILNGGEE